MTGLSKLAPREALELHEIVRGEVTCARKLQAGLALVQDAELKAFMQNSLQLKLATLRDYRQFADTAGPLQ